MQPCCNHRVGWWQVKLDPQPAKQPANVCKVKHKVNPLSKHVPNLIPSEGKQKVMELLVFVVQGIRQYCIGEHTLQHIGPFL